MPESNRLQDVQAFYESWSDIDDKSSGAGI